MVYIIIMTNNYELFLYIYIVYILIMIDNIQYFNKNIS